MSTGAITINVFQERAMMTGDRAHTLGVGACIVGVALSLTIMAAALVGVHVERTNAEALVPLARVVDGDAGRCVPAADCALLVEAIEVRDRAIATIAEAAIDPARHRERSAWRLLATGAFIGVLFVICLGCLRRRTGGANEH